MEKEENNLRHLVFFNKFQEATLLLFPYFQNLFQEDERNTRDSMLR